MNIKNSIFALLIGITPLTMHAMEKNTPEENLFAKKITIQDYLLEIEHGLYGKNIAQQLHEIHSAVYTPSTTEQPSDLYALLKHLMRFATGRKGAHNPENIKELIIKQIQIKHKTLLDYKERGLAQIPSVSGE